ncbi:hypothetical protein CLV98_11614 [Dyadobacter jejuensis]|uniref:LTXXQ motif family protein n=1 Tax=Dyadobacter jejuensis TaxID=1082580 RepID=A0A316ABC6_9BACT|nr:hypothetical protein [Dyadobacter jejuensis]PWJ54729.1 hypothetical protein CLV98_11614 [Dyadobacter jejuensis]
MKSNYKNLLLGVIVLLCFSVMPSLAQKAKDGQAIEQTTSKLNNRRLDKNLERYKEELDLSKKQIKQLSKIDKRYARLERKVDRKDGTRKDKRLLSEQKREEMIEVLNEQQQVKLQALIKKGRFSFDQWFGK